MELTHDIDIWVWKEPKKDFLLKIMEAQIKQESTTREYTAEGILLIVIHISWAHPIFIRWFPVQPNDKVTLGETEFQLIIE